MGFMWKLLLLLVVLLIIMTVVMVEGAPEGLLSRGRYYLLSWTISNKRTRW